MSLKKTLYWVSLFSIAMGFLEAAVVIYLRKLYYPSGFVFPLRAMDHDLAVTELWREAATILMLFAIGKLAGKNKAERFAYFIFSFAVWDIFYYVFLKIFIGWPESLMTWDILFLIPVPWVGPVVTPVIIAMTLILFALAIIYYSERKVNVHLNSSEKLLLWAGSAVAIISFTEDCIRHKGDVMMRNMKSSGTLLIDMSTYIPTDFDWTMFSIGEGIILFSFFVYLKRLGKSNPPPGTI